MQLFLMPVHRSRESCTRVNRHAMWVTKGYEGLLMAQHSRSQRARDPDDGDIEDFPTWFNGHMPLA